MKKYLFPAALATILLATSCSDNDMAEPITPDGQKELISLTLGLGDDTPAMAKRAGRASYGFTADTRILMRIQSDDNEAATGNHRYTKTLAKAGVRGANPSTGADQQFSTVFPVSPNGDAYKRYWDDAFGRNAHLSVFAVAIPNMNNPALLPEDALKGSSTNWETTANDNKITWTVNASQSSTTLKEQDLVYSRNIRKDGTTAEAGRYVWSFTNNPQGYVPNIERPLTDKNVFTKDRMRFTLSNSSDPTSPGKFDQGHLIFNHSLSRLTITIKSGKGFDAGNKFILSDAGVQALVMNTSGTLDVSTGQWTVTHTGTIATHPTVVRPSGYASYTTKMQMLPGYQFVKDDPTNVLKFTIDNNEYYITNGLIHQALRKNHANNGLTDTDDPYTMEQGKNYVLTITVNKTKIESLTATLADWVDVEAAKEELYNSYVTLKLKDTDGTPCEDFDLYRLGVGDGKIHTSETVTDKTADAYENYEWKGNYTDYLTTNASADENKKLEKYTGADGKEKWKTPWFFDDNKTFYHFRTVKAGTTIVGATGVNADATDDYFAINDGPISGANEVDPHWGAPLDKDKSGITDPAKQYNTTANTTGNAHEGYTDIIYKAIGSTTGTIAIQEFHMLSEINVIVKTKAENLGGVKLKDGDVYTTVTLYQIAQNGQVKMGNGFVTAQTPYTYSVDLTKPATFFKTDPTETNAFTWRVVPQTLSRGDNKTDKVAIKIQTPDNNLYYCIDDLSEIPVNGTSDPIDYWKPNHSYTYTFIISKKGIDQITCTVADWIDVKAADKDINLEN